MIPLGPFDLIKPIGRGGSCEVWQGIHREQGLPAAIKIVFGKKAKTSRFISAFREEVRAVAGLSHPSIVMVFDYGLIPPETAAQSGGRIQEGSPYLVMELGEETLHAFCDRLTWPKTYQILLSLLDALAHAHARGVLHRDIKPANILVCNEHQQVKLTDFGLAHAFDKDKAPRHAREIVGTPAYMAPEQFELRWRDYGPWTDLYAFGCTTYALLSGFPPFGRTEQLEDMMAAHLYQAIPRLPPRLYVPEGFEEWLHRLLHKEPSQRFQRAADAAWALVQIENRRHVEHHSVAEGSGERSSPFALDSFNREELWGDENDGPSLHTLHSLVGTPTPSVLPAVTDGMLEAFAASREALNDSHPMGEHSPISQELDRPVASDSLEAEETINHPPELSPSFIVEDGSLPTWTLYANDVLPSPSELQAYNTPFVDEEEPTPTLSDTQQEQSTQSSPKKSSNSTPLPTRIAVGGEREFIPDVPPFPETWRRSDLTETTRILNDVGLGLYNLRTIPLIAREAERDQLWDVLQRVISERETQIVCLSGPTGSGKSRLAEWLCERAHEVGVAHVLKAHYNPIPRSTNGFGAMLSRYLRCSGLEQKAILERVEAGMTSRTPIALEEAHTLVELMSPTPDSTETAPLIRFGNSHERYEAIRMFAERLGQRRSTLLWLDDVHWSYDALSFVSYMLQNQARRPTPALIVMTVREEILAEREGETELLNAILEHSHTTHIHISPLTPQENSNLIRELLGLQGELAWQVEQCTAGNPLFAVQLVGDWIQRGLLHRSARGFQLKEGVQVEIPDNLHQVWNGRIERFLEHFPSEQAIALELAATLGIEVDRSEWESVCSLAGISVSDKLLEKLFEQRLAYSAEGGAQVSCSFVHSMLRESLERRAREAERWHQHQMLCAQMLEQKKGPRMAERLGRHLLLAGENEKALQPLLKGIWEQLDAGDFRRSELLFSDWRSILTRLELPSRHALWGEAWLIRCRLARAFGSFEEGARLAQWAIRDARKFGWDHVLFHAILERANYRWRLGAPEEEVWSLLLEAKEQTCAQEDPKLQAECSRYMGNFLCSRGYLERAAKHFREALCLFEAAKDKTGMARCCFGLSNVERQSGRFAEARQHVLNAQKRYKAIGLRRGIVDCLNSLGDLARFENDLEASEAYYRDSLARYEALGGFDTSISKLNISLVLIYRERFDEARTLLEELLSFLQERKQRDLEGIAHLSMLPCAAFSQDWSAWKYHIEQAHALLNEVGFCDVDSAQVAQLAGDMARNMGAEKEAIAAYELSSRQWELLGRTEDVELIQRLLPPKTH